MPFSGHLDLSDSSRVIFVQEENIMAKKFTIRQIALALRCHEQSARILLSEVSEKIDNVAGDFAELIDARTLIALYRRHENTKIARRLLPLLQSVD